VLGGDLGQVGVLVGGERGHELPRHLGGLLGGVERQARLLEREAVAVAVEQRVGVGGQLDGEAGVAEDAEDGVVVSDGGGSWGAA
jgi:hypothetical protein